MAFTEVDLGLPLLRPNDQFEIWRQTLLPLFEVDYRGMHEGATFDASLRLIPLGDAVMSICGSQAQAFSRSMADVRTSGWDHIVIQNYTRGGFSGVCGDSPISVRAGDINILDLGNTLSTEASAFSNLTLVLPRARLPLANTHSVHGAVLSRSDALAPVVAQHMAAIASHAGSLSELEMSACIEALCLMLSSSSLRDAEAGVRSAAGASLRSRVASYIDQHLADPELDPDRIAGACHVSRASLYRLFTPDGGVMAFIAGRRLDRAFDLLSHTSVSPPTIAQIGGMVGFVSETHFGRAFRQRFAMTPREARRLPRAAKLSILAGGRSPSDWVFAMRQLRQAYPD